MTCLEHDVDLDQFGGNVRHVGEIRYVKHQIPAGMVNSTNNESDKWSDTRNITQLHGYRTARCACLAV